MHLTSLARLFFVVAIYCSCDSLHAVQEAGKTETAPLQANQVPAANQANRTAAIDRLVEELDELIPGDYAIDSEQVKKLREITEFFVSRNERNLRSALDELAILDPKTPPTDLLIAGLSYATNNATQGKLLLERAATNYRTHPGIALAFARLALLQGRYYDALALTEKARSLNESSELDKETKSFYETSSLDSLTIIELRRNQLKEARQYAKQWEDIAPKSDKMLMASAEIRFLLKNVDDAIEYLKRRGDAKKGELPTDVVIAKWYQSNGDVENYSKWIQTAYKNHADNSLTQMEYAAWLLRKEDFEKAMLIVDSYELSHGESYESKLIKGRVAFSRQDYSSSEAIFTGLYQSQPNNFEHGYLLALSLLENSNPEKQKQAVSVSQRNYQLFPNNQLTVATVGWALFRTGSKEVGRELLGKASKTGNLLPDTAFMLADMMEEDDRDTQAKIILDPFVDSPDIFIFRSRARALLTKITADDDLPKPDPSK